MVAHIYNSRIWEAQVGSWKVWVQLEVQSKAFSQNKQEIVNREKKRKSAGFEKQTKKYFY